MTRIKIIGLMVMTALLTLGVSGTGQRPRARDLGIRIGTLEPGVWNAITDVKGVTVGQVTLVQGPSIRTGITVIVPHEGNIFQQKVPAAVHVGNGFGKLTGVSQIQELGNIETPIALTNTLSVWTVANALVDYTLAENPGILSVNPVVGETNDGWLNDIRGRHVRKSHLFTALRNARSGPVREGNVGAGTGTRCLGFKGGIGTASRHLPAEFGSYTVGVLVQSNFGGNLRINGISIARKPRNAGQKEDSSGSCMIVVATDAPLEFRNLQRVARRAILGMARIGGTCRNGSGDFVIAFSTHPEIRVLHQQAAGTESAPRLRNEFMSPLFLAVIEATEEAILNSLLAATTMRGRNGHIQEALPIETLKKLLCTPARKNG